MDNIGGADLADIHLISRFNKGILFLLCGIDMLLLFYYVLFSKCAWVIPLNDKKDITICNTFQKILDKSIRKPNKIWVDNFSKFHNR